MGGILPWILLTAFVAQCQALKVLVVFAFPGKSHSILGDGVVRHLVAAKHEVTYVTPYPSKTPPTNYRQVDISGLVQAFGASISLKSMMDKTVDFNDQGFISQFMLKVVDKAMEQKNLKDLIEDPRQEFDVVIIEWMFSEVYAGIAELYGAPCIWLFPFEHPPGILGLIDEWPNPAYTSNLYLHNDVLPFNFVQRLKALYKQTVIYFYKLYHTSEEEEMYKKSFAAIFKKRGRTLPAFEDVRYNISLALVNSHISLGTSLRAPPNYINVGGYHINTDVKPLPKDLQKIMDDSKNGVIYFSLGSNLKSRELPEEIKKGLLKMFGRLEQTVLWKFEEELPGLPKNVHILQWAPQPSILAHPNCVMFITHGGLLSSTETVHFGKPIIGIPVFADQFLNIDKAVARGYAKRVDLSFATPSELEAAIHEVISNRSYAAKAMELSMIYHDRPVPPGRELVHWVEHVVRTRGAPHLRSPALLVPLYQKFYLDLAALVLAILLLLRALVKTCTSKTSAQLGRKKNN